MPICQKCSSQFPNWYKINGKNKNLHNRKYCLTCSPFGQHNTKQLVLRENNKKCICVNCNKEYLYDKKKGHTLVKCNACYVKKRRVNLKQKSIEKMGGKCSICGYSKCLNALQFHHTNPSVKNFNISSNIGRYALQSIQNELKKCIVVCANCHFEIHSKETEA